MIIKYGAVLLNEQTDVFVVESQWPDKKKGSGTKRFSSYCVSAFDDIDHRSKCERDYGTFDAKNKDVAKHKSRLENDRGDRAARFTDCAAALAYAARLQERGRLTAAQGTEPWRSDYEGVVHTRVVRELTQSSKIIVIGMEE